ncbi:MAG: hypothetical protein Q4B22_07155 [Eubacteriales bacterium]|nr:hypothetical protein [Eubacteriales bacterium]
MTLQVEKEVLLTAAEHIGETALHLAKLQERAEQLVSRTAGFWEGEAAAIFRDNCREQGEEFRELLSRIQKYETEICEIAGLKGSAATGEEKEVLKLDSFVLDDL